MCPGILSLVFLASKSLEDFSSSLEESKDENQFTLINIPEFLKVLINSCNRPIAVYWRNFF